MYSFTHYLVMYDIADSSRAVKVLAILRCYCHHVQNSIFEGKLRKSQLYELKDKLESAISLDEDSVLIYPLSYLNLFNKISLGKPRFRKGMIF